MSVTDVIRVHTRETVRTGRYAIIGAQPADARRVWFVLHGYGQLASTVLRPFDGIVPPDTCVVAPEGLSRFYREMPKPDGSHLQRVGATWMTREAREDDIADTRRWLQQVHDHVLDEALSGIPNEARVSCTVGLLAFSQGAATATRWIASSGLRPRLRHWVVWAGGVASDVDEACMREHLADVDVTLVAGDADPFVSADSLNRTLAQLRAWQPRTDVRRFSGDHRLEPDTLRALLEGLQPFPEPS